jgi:glycosyltransferase involved in cell wall biosynthesis
VQEKTLKVLILGDSPLGKTGFGRVNYHAMTAFLRQGWEVASVLGLQSEAHKTDLPLIQFVPDLNKDPMGTARAIHLFENKEFEPDIVYATGDPGSISMFAMVVPASTRFLAYCPIEGEPLVNSTWRATLSGIDFFTCSNYGAEVVKGSIGRTVDMVYHGVDREKFYPLSGDERAQYRERLGWDGKFVVSVVAQNVRRKQLTRLIEAVAILKNQYNQKDIVLYLHTVPFQKHWLEGWNLPEVSAAFGLTDEVVFNPLMDGFGKGVPETGDMDVPGLRELVGASDLFVLPSQVEGFGLPIAEAMAVGTPVAVTKYAAGWEVASLGSGAGIVPHDWEIHKSGTRYANLDPQEIAKTILVLKRNPRKLQQMRDAGLKAVDNFDWSKFEEYVVGKVEDVCSRPPLWNNNSTEEDQGREATGA